MKTYSIYGQEVEIQEGAWYSWMEVPPPYGTRSIECKRGLTGPVFPLNPATMHPLSNVADLFWKDAL